MKKKNKGIGAHKARKPKGAVRQPPLQASEGVEAILPQLAGGYTRVPLIGLATLVL